MHKRFIEKIPKPLFIYAICIGAGLIMSLPFLFYKLGWLVIISLIPFLYVLQYLGKLKLSNRSIVGYIWLTGWVMMLGVTFWILQSDPQRWAGLTAWWAAGMLILIYLLLSAILSFGFFLFGLAWVYLQPKFQQKRIFLLLPAIWVICEWLRSWMFSIISAGPNTSLGMHWNFGDLGFAISVTPVVYLGRLGGLLGLSFVVVVINLCIFWLIQKRWKLPLLILISIFLLTFFGWWLYRIPNGNTVKVSALQLGTNSDLEIGSIDFRPQLQAQSTLSSTDILVLSEYSDIFNEQHIDEDKSLLQRIAANQEMPIITSRQRTTNDTTFNSVTVYQPDASIGYQYDKQFLIPIGEAMPYTLTALLKVIGQGRDLKIREITKGTIPANAYSLNGITIGSQACSGAISPELYRELTNDGAQLLTNSASLSILSGSFSYHSQAQQMARFMAVANARPFVQATDGSYSFMIDNNGNWLKKSNKNTIELLQQQLVLNGHKTLYTILGEWVVLVAGISLVIFGWLSIKNK